MKKINKRLRLSSSLLDTKTQRNQKALVKSIKLLFGKVNSLIDENRELKKRINQLEEQTND